MCASAIDRLRTKSNFRMSGCSDADSYRDQIKTAICRLHCRSRQGFIAMAVFFPISIVALYCRNLEILDAFPGQMRVVLGSPPPASIINIVLAVSTVCALIIIAGRRFNGREPGSVWTQLGYRSVFYVFYLFPNALNQYFIFVFLTGVVVLAAEQYLNWSHSTRRIMENERLLEKLSLWPMAASSNRN